MTIKRTLFNIGLASGLVAIIGGCGSNNKPKTQIDLECPSAKGYGVTLEQGNNYIGKGKGPTYDTLTVAKFNPKTNEFVDGDFLVAFDTDRNGTIDEIGSFHITTGSDLGRLKSKEILTKILIEAKSRKWIVQNVHTNGNQGFQTLKNVLDVNLD